MKRPSIREILAAASGAAVVILAVLMHATHAPGPGANPDLYAFGAGTPVSNCNFYSSAPTTLTISDYYPCRIDSSHGQYVFVDNTVPVSGTFWQSTQPVSGTFWQSTQPVSLASLPSLPTGTNAIGTVQVPDVRSVGNTVNSATLNAALTTAVTGEGTVGFNFVGLTASTATLTFEASTDNGTTYKAVYALLESTNVLATTATVDGIYTIGAAGFTNVRARVSTVGSGNITESVTASVASSSPQINTYSGSAADGTQAGLPASGLMCMAWNAATSTADRCQVNTSDQFLTFSTIGPGTSAIGTVTLASWPHIIVSGSTTGHFGSTLCSPSPACGYLLKTGAGVLGGLRWVSATAMGATTLTCWDGTSAGTIDNEIFFATNMSSGEQPIIEAGGEAFTTGLFCQVSAAISSSQNVNFKVR